MEPYTKADEAGFTIIELVMVVVIMGILGVSIASRSSTDTATYIELEEFVMAVRDTQARSLDDEAGHQIVRTGSSTVEVQNSAGTVLKTYTFERITVPAFTTISFDEYGEPSAGTSITLTASGGFSQAVTVVSETGYTYIP